MTSPARLASLRYRSIRFLMFCGTLRVHNLSFRLHSPPRIRLDRARQGLERARPSWRVGSHAPMCCTRHNRTPATIGCMSPEASRSARRSRLGLPSRRVSERSGPTAGLFCAATANSAYRRQERHSSPRSLASALTDPASRLPAIPQQWFKVNQVLPGARRPRIMKVRLGVDLPHTASASDRA